MTSTNTQNPSNEPDDGPPIMGSWNRLYILVLILHILFIGFFYSLTLWLS